MVVSQSEKRREGAIKRGRLMRGSGRKEGRKEGRREGSDGRKGRK